MNNTDQATEQCTFDFHGECEPCVLAAGHAGLHRCKHQPQSRVFDGEMSSEFETWLGKAFNSWMPSRRGVEIATSNGVGLQIAYRGDTITLFEGGTVVTPGEQAP